MKKREYEVKEVIFEKCPICGKGKVETKESTKLFGLITSDETSCDKCNAEFIEEDEKGNERTFSLNLSNSDQKSKYEDKTLKISEWKRGKSDFDVCIEKGILPKAKILGLKVILKPNEETHWYSAAEMKEERAVRHASFGRVRVAKGIYVGGSRGESHGELRTIDSGDLLLTNQRLIFNGNMRNIEYKLDKIVSVQEYADGVEIGSTSRKKVQVYIVDEPHKWAGYIKLAVQKYYTSKLKKKKK